jgi:hypothetical protein
MDTWSTVVFGLVLAGLILKNWKPLKREKKSRRYFVIAVYGLTVIVFLSEVIGFPMPQPLKWYNDLVSPAVRSLVE